MRKINSFRWPIFDLKTHFTNMFTKSFYTCRSQKRKKDSQVISVFLCFCDLCVLNQLIKHWLNWPKISYIGILLKQICGTLFQHTFAVWYCIFKVVILIQTMKLKKFAKKRFQGYVLTHCELLKIVSKSNKKIWTFCEQRQSWVAYSVVDFTNIFIRSFCARRLWKRKKTDDLTVFFTLLGSAHVKVVCRMLMKLSPGAIGSIRKRHSLKTYNSQISTKISWTNLPPFNYAAFWCTCM